VASAALLAPLGLFCVWQGGWLFAILVLAVSAGLGFEWAGLLRLKLRSLRGIVLLLWPAVCCVALLTGRSEGVYPLLASSLILGPFVAAGVFAAGIASLSLLWLRLGTGAGWHDVLFVMLVVWASDSAAYFSGRTFGGPKLAPRISPGKTWSGSLGGLVGAALVGAIVAWSFNTADVPVALLRGLAAGALLGLVAQAGDLAESLFKRRCGAKDSGRLIPGHGGLLDRLDGLMAAAPVAALLSLAAPLHQPFWFADGRLAAWSQPAHPLLEGLPGAR